MTRASKTRRLLIPFLAVGLVLAMQPATGTAAPLARTTTQLSAADPSQDGSDVAFAGEAIGEALRAGDDHVWVNVLAGATGIGVYASRAQAADIRSWGDYTRDGDIVEVAGTLNTACDQHGGDLDVHAASLRVTSRGSERLDPISTWQFIVALALGSSALGAFALTTRRRWRARV